MPPKLTPADAARLGATVTEVNTQALGMTRKRKHKYGATPTEVDGIRFASKKEARRWGELKLFEKVGQISGLERQVKYPLHAAGGKLVGHYVADARYVEDGKLVVEDCKGMRTREYLWKKKHMKAQYGIDIRET